MQVEYPTVMSAEIHGGLNTLVSSMHSRQCAFYFPRPFFGFSGTSVICGVTLIPIRL